jgi:UDP-GlcNAc:undecaprenyl-phosphate GlcNAc-1-phosphate transferase
MVTLEITALVYSIAAIICAGLLSFALTPAVRVLAFKINAVDTPKDGRRMHDHPIPRIGGLAIFIAFVVSMLIFCELSPTMLSLLVGGSILVVLGVVDDIKALNPWIKLIVQIFVGFIPVLFGVKIDFITLFGGAPIGLEQYHLDIPITVLWIVGLTNAVNLIDGLDGLACGVSAICCLSICAVTLINSEWQFALITAIMFGACIGFLPFNSNPAKIFMGDTGALFLGYTMAVLSVSGLFKIHAALSFLVPLSIFGLPIFDTFFAIVRRLIHGKSPFSADRGHLHHRLIDMGFGQKHSVRILYAICGILGIAAVMLSHPNLYRAAIVLLAAIIIFLINFVIFRNPQFRIHTGFNDEAEANKQNKEEDKNEK